MFEVSVGKFFSVPNQLDFVVAVNLINLASKEYSTVMNHPNVYTVIFEEFKNGKWKQLSTMSKQRRGKLARYVVEQEIRDIDELPNDFQGFVKLAEDKIIKYRKFD